MGLRALMIQRRSVTAGGAALGILLMGCAVKTRTAESPPETLTAARAAALLGDPPGEVVECQPLLPELYRVIIEEDGEDRILGLLLDGGDVVEARGYGPAARYLGRIDGEIARGGIQAYDLALGLELLGALPPPFVANDVSTEGDVEGATGGLKAAPLSLRLVTQKRVNPRDLGPDGGARVGGDGAPADGFAPAIWSRATLTGGDGSPYRWTVERWDDEAWTELARWPLSP